MKNKLKAPDVAKDKGLDYVKKELKKRLAEPFAEGAVQFLYDAKFNYKPFPFSPQPLLFVGELSSEWRKYLKENKTKDSIAAGRCLPDKDNPTILNFEVKLGKGGKQKFLKDINKELLKPFAEARFVDSIESGKVLDGDIKDIVEDKSAEATSIAADATANELLEEGKELLTILASGKNVLETTIPKLEPMAKNKAAFKDEVIEQIKKDYAVIEEVEIDVLIMSADSWLRGDAKKQMAADKEIAEVYNKLGADVSAAKSLRSKISPIKELIEHLDKVTLRRASMPISKNQLNNFNASMESINKKFDDLASIGDNLKVT